MVKGQWANLARMPFFEGHPGIVNEHRESGPRLNVSSERQCLLTV